MPAAQSKKKINQSVKSDKLKDKNISKEIEIEKKEDNPAMPKLSESSKLINHEHANELGLKVKKFNVRNIFWFFMPVFLIFIAILGGIFIYLKGVNKMNSEKLIEKSVVSDNNKTFSNPLSPTPVKKIDLKKYNIQIINGSGVEGAASIAKRKLEKKGYAVVGVGNADNSNYSDDVIRHKNYVESVFISNLKDFVDTEQIEEVDNIESDIEIILGRND